MIKSSIKILLLMSILILSRGESWAMPYFQCSDEESECREVQKAIDFSDTSLLRTPGNKWQDPDQDEANADGLDFWCEQSEAEKAKLQGLKTEKKESPEYLKFLRDSFFEHFRKSQGTFKEGEQRNHVVCSIYYRDQYASKLIFPWKREKNNLDRVFSRYSIYNNEMQELVKMLGNDSFRGDSGIGDSKNDDPSKVYSRGSKKEALAMLVGGIETEWLIWFMNYAYIKKMDKTYKWLIPGAIGVLGVSGLMLSTDLLAPLGFKTYRLGTFISQFALRSAPQLTAPIGYSFMNTANMKQKNVSVKIGGVFDGNNVEFPEPASYFPDDSGLVNESVEEALSARQKLMNGDITAIIKGFFVGFGAQIKMGSGRLGSAIENTIEKRIDRFLSGITSILPDMGVSAKMQRRFRRL